MKMQRVSGRATRAARDEMLIQRSQKAWIADESPALPEDQDTRRMCGREVKEREEGARTDGVVVWQRQRAWQACLTSPPRTAAASRANNPYAGPLWKGHTCNRQGARR